MPSKTIPAKSVIFDFDGVIVQSVDIKAQAFVEVYKDEGASFAREILEYQHRHGGISRREKFKYFENELFGRNPGRDEIEILSQRYTETVHRAVIECPFVDGALQLLASLRNRISMHLVSGTPTEELLDIARTRDLDGYFATIVGAPTSKPDAFARILESEGLDPDEVVAIGDSLTEYEAAERLGIPFIGIVENGRPNRFPATVPHFANLVGMDRWILEGRPVQL